MDAAAGLLAFKEDSRTAAGLIGSVKSDPFWAVRKSSLEALAQLKAKNGPAALKGACQDPDPQVRAAALVALGDLKDRTLTDFYKGLFQKDASYRVQAEALRALGKTGDPAVIPFLRQSASVPSHQNMVKRAAESAIKQLEKK